MRRERDTIPYYPDCSYIVSSHSTHWLNQRAGIPLTPTCLASASSENQLATSKSKSQLTAFFFQIPKSSDHRFQEWHHSHPQFHFLLVFLLWHLWFSHPPRALNVCTELTYALSRKVPSLTKSKGKIYETKNDNKK